MTAYQQRCVGCRKPLNRAILLDGYTTHPTCDDKWTARERFAQLDKRTTVGIIPCTQQHEALIVLDRLDEPSSCVRCSLKTYRI